MILSIWPSTEEYAAGKTSPTTYSSFADLYAETFATSVAYLQVHFRVSREIAEECIQTTFLKLWERNPGFVGIDHPLKYVHAAIVVNTKEHLRTKQHSPVLSAQSLDTPLAPDTPFTLGDSWSLQHQGMSVEETVIVREQLRQASEYLHRLPDMQQVLIQMNAAGYSYAEIRTYLRDHYGFHGSLKAIEHRLADSRRQIRQQVRVQRQHQRVIRRKQSRKFPGWATQYVACIVCGTTAIAHKAHGKCQHCYDQEHKAKVRQSTKSR